MKVISGALVLAALLAMAPARAADIESCSVPAYLLSSPSALPRVAEVVKAKEPLNIIVVGSRSSSLNAPQGADISYPARLEAALREQLPGIEVHVALDLHTRQTAEDVAPQLDKLAGRKPALVIWQTGTVDALRSVDPDDFLAAVDEGVATLQRMHSDVILMNLQYSPRTETMLPVTSYNDTIRVIAQQRNVPMFDRFAIMRYWSEAGDFDLFGTVHGFEMAKRVHDCIGRALSKLMIEAAHINLAELGTVR